MRQINDTRKTLYEPNKKFDKETEIIDKNQTKILELKNTMNARVSKGDLIKEKIYFANSTIGHLKLLNQKRKKNE